MTKHVLSAHDKKKSYKSRLYPDFFRIKWDNKKWTGLQFHSYLGKVESRVRAEQLFYP